MPRACAVCNHEKREDIEKALAAGEKLRTLAEKYGMSTAAISRHRSHMEDEPRDEKGRRPDQETVPKPLSKPLPEPSLKENGDTMNGLGLVCPRCGEMELYFAGWVDDRTAAIECPWCPHTGYVRDFTVGTIALTVGDASEIADNAPRPAGAGKKKSK